MRMKSLGRMKVSLLYSTRLKRDCSPNKLCGGRQNRRGLVSECISENGTGTRTWSGTGWNRRGIENPGEGIGGNGRASLYRRWTPKYLTTDRQWPSAHVIMVVTASNT